eukprot:Nk52_evm52s236 gene=Nk52_evmTU52s236
MSSFGERLSEVGVGVSGNGGCLSVGSRAGSSDRSEDEVETREKGKVYGLNSRSSLLLRGGSNVGGVVHEVSSHSDDASEAGEDSSSLMREDFSSVFLGKTRVYAYVVLAMLVLVYALNQFDRFILTFIKDEMQADIHFTDAEYGLLVGYATTVVFGAFGLLGGYLADTRIMRKTMVFGGLVLWSIMLIFQGISHTYWQILLCKIGLGIGMAASTPAMFSLIPDYFPAVKRPLANSILEQSVYIGAGLSSAISGILSSMEAIGWRKTLCFVGGLGTAVAVIGYIIVKEPRRGAYSGDSKREVNPGPLTTHRSSYSAKECMYYLVELKSFWKVLVAGGFRMMAGYTFGGFIPSYIKNNFPGRREEVSIYYGLVILFVGSASCLLGGRITQKFWKRDRRVGLWIGAIGSIATIPFLAMVIYARDIVRHSEDAAMALTFVSLSAAYIFAEGWLGPTAAVIQILLPEGMMTIGFSLYLMIINFIGGSGPELLGILLINSSESSDPNTTNHVLFYVISGAYLIAAPWFVFASLSIDGDIKNKLLFQLNEGPVPTRQTKRLAFFAFFFGLLLAIIVTLIIISLIL